jgi:hypothetical protein
MTMIPSVIKVGPYRVRVSLDADALARTRVLKGDRRIGEFSNIDLTILIDDECAPDLLAETLLHETIHAVFEVVGGCRGEHDSEAWIQYAAPTLLAVLRDNPALVAYLLDPEDTHAEEEATDAGSRGKSYLDRRR